MGTDIYLAVEVATPGGWTRAEPMVPNRYAGEGEPHLVREEWYQQRNYELFAMLADVRNRHGFTPLAPEPRGLPDDVSDETGRDFDSLGVGHSASWFTARELFEFDWFGRTVTRWGIFDAADAHNARVYIEEFGRPPRSVSYCMGVSGPGVLVKTASGDHIRAGDNAPDIPTHEELTWTETYAESAGGEWFTLLARLVRLALRNGGDLDRVRIVFCFD